MTATTPGRRFCPLMLVAVLTLFAASASGQSFYPEIAAEISHTDNVSFTSELEAEDTIYRVSVLLPVTRDWKTGSFTLRYQPVYEVYEEFEALDNLSHFLSLDVASNPSPLSSIQFVVDVTKTQQQGGAQSLDTSNLFVTRRTDRERAALDFSLLRRTPNRWSWRLSTGLEATQFEEISGFDDAAPPTDLEDRAGFEAALELGRDVSRTTSIGVAYGWERFDLDVSGEETVQRVALVTRQEVGKRSSLTFYAGSFRATGDTLALTADNEETGFFGELRIVRTYRRSVLEGSASYGPSLGGARLGTSVDGLLSLGLSSENTRRVDWELFARYALREPNAPQQGDLESAAIEARIARRIGRQVSVGLRGSYFDQSGNAPSEKASVYKFGLGLVWHLNARSGPAGGQSTS